MLLASCCVDVHWLVIYQFLQHTLVLIMVYYLLTPGVEIPGFYSVQSHQVSLTSPEIQNLPVLSGICLPTRQCLRLIAAWSHVQQTIIDDVVDQWRESLRCCVKANSRHFKHLLWIFLLRLMHINLTVSGLKNIWFLLRLIFWHWKHTQSLFFFYFVIFIHKLSIIWNHRYKNVFYVFITV